MTDDLPLYAPMDSLPGVIGRVTRADVVAEARTWIGTPYVHQHRMKGHGVDCVGLVICVARELALVEPNFDVGGYSRKPDGKSMLGECDSYMNRIALDQLLPGHVLVYEFDTRLGPQHMGIVADYLHGGLSLIQALGTTDGKGEVVEWNLARPRKGWKPKQAYSLRGVE